MKNDVLNYEMKSGYGIGVYCGTYSKYNECSLYGMWVDLEQFTDAEDFFEVCRQLHEDESDPEFMFQDYQGFPEEFYHESMCVDDVQKILDYLQLSEDEREMLDAYCKCFGKYLTDFDGLLYEARERNCGQWDSFQAFADNMADEEICNHSLGQSTEFFERYFDYEAYARDLECDYYISDNGYIFSAR